MQSPLSVPPGIQAKIGQLFQKGAGEIEINARLNFLRGSWKHHRHFNKNVFVAIVSCL